MLFYVHSLYCLVFPFPFAASDPSAISEQEWFLPLLPSPSPAQPVTRVGFLRIWLQGHVYAQWHARGNAWTLAAVLARKKERMEEHKKHFLPLFSRKDKLR